MNVDEIDDKIPIIANNTHLFYFCIQMHHLIRHNEDNIRQLCIKYNVKSLFAFGSVTTDQFTDDSDIDLLVSFMPMSPEDYADAYLDLADSFEALLKKPIDLVTEKSLRNPYFIESINKTKSKIYEA